MQQHGHTFAVNLILRATEGEKVVAGLFRFRLFHPEGIA
jgi:hypothetical protein